MTKKINYVELAKAANRKETLAEKKAAKAKKLVEKAKETAAKKKTSQTNKSQLLDWAYIVDAYEFNETDGDTKVTKSSKLPKKLAEFLFPLFENSGFGIIEGKDKVKEDDYWKFFVYNMDNYTGVTTLGQLFERLPKVVADFEKKYGVKVNTH